MDIVEGWAVAERTYIQEEIKWLKAGQKVISPSGDDISAARMEQLLIRLEHADKAINQLIGPA